MIWIWEKIGKNIFEQFSVHFNSIWTVVDWPSFPTWHPHCKHVATWWEISLPTSNSIEKTYLKTKKDEKYKEQYRKWKKRWREMKKGDSHGAFEDVCLLQRFCVILLFVTHRKRSVKCYLHRKALKRPIWFRFHFIFNESTQKKDFNHKLYIHSLIKSQ